LAVDLPHSIQGGRKNGSKIMCTVKWKPRLDGTQPLDSEVESEKLKENYLNLLLDFYESRINF